MKKNEVEILEGILTNCKNLNEESKNRLLWITEGMVLVGGGKNANDTKH